MISRRNFITRSLGWMGSSLGWHALQSCGTSHSIPARIVGQNAALGHRLRSMSFGEVAEEIKKDIVIVGGGVAGLSAARHLQRAGQDFLLLELNNEPGGNSLGGQNAVSAFPWGAHYLPLPDTHDPELITFLQETGVITGFENGLPVYNDYYLCFDPKERLYINHYWQEGIIPREGVPKKDREEIERFLALMQQYKNKKGNDGRYAFAIPVDHSSQDPSLLALDTLTMGTFLEEYGFRSPYLKWYINYCCADDFGSTLEETSAWAAIHYFASRKGKAANATSDTMLTWPEGNFWLVRQMEKKLRPYVKLNTLVYHITTTRDHVEILYFDVLENTSVKVIARSVIMATPQFVNQRLLPATNRAIDYARYQYAPWMVANITTNATLNERHGELLSWDNVLYGSSSLGYVNATHQHPGTHHAKKVITYYQPLTSTDTRVSRTKAYQKTPEEWTATILNDLKKPHLAIAQSIENIDIWVWGHGMIKPIPNFIWSSDRRKAKEPLGQRIYFAHSDLSGISIFEEAFYHGHRAAKDCLAGKS